MMDRRKILPLLLLFAGFCCIETLTAQDLTLKIGVKAPVLQCSPLTSNDKNPLKWDELKGRVVILDFWATWCSPCIASIPRLDSLVSEFKGKPVSFYSVSYEPDTIVTPFLRKHPMNTTVCLDRDFATFRTYKAWGIPMIVLVNKMGIIAGVIHPSKLTSSVIQTVLSGKTPAVEQEKGWPDPEGAETYFRSTVSEKKKQK